MFTNNYRKIFESYFTCRSPRGMISHKGNSIEFPSCSGEFVWNPWMLGTVSPPINWWNTKTLFSMSDSGVSLDLTSFFKDSPTCLNTTRFLLLGQGSTPPTRNDYKIEQPILTSVTFNTEAYYGTDDSGKYYWYETLLISNSGSTLPITISELGIYTTNTTFPNNINNSTYFYVSTPITPNNICLIERTVLDTPVVLNYLESASITYKITTDVKIENVIK